jgi:hypothetical protein
MRRSFLTLAVVAIICLTAAVPASAQTWFQLRYWSTNQLWNAPGPIGPDTWDSALWGFSVRRNVVGGLWALSFNYDSGGITNPVGVTAPSDSYNRFWNLNLHRNFPFATGNASLYGGLGSLAIEIPSFPAYVRQRGPRIGADVRFALPGNWFVVGDLAYTFNGTAEQLSYSVGGTLPLSATAVEYRAGLGYSMGRWGLEGGYRVINWNHTTAAFCGGAASCSFRWSGWYAGLNFTAP